MKLVKMSLAAAVLLGASAFAIDNVKVSGDAKLFYGTNNAGTADLFDKGDEFAALTTGAGAYADTALRLGVTGDLLKGVSFGVTGYAVSTLGLENNLVSQTWTGAHGVTTGTGSNFADFVPVDGAQVDDASWMGEMWVAATLGKTTAKLGRMELDTPLAFSEKWSVVPNTFEGAVILNQDLPDTTLVGAWVGKGNGGAHELLGGAAFVGNDLGVVGAKGKFNTFVHDGAYAAAIVNNSFKPLTAQAWYYNVLNVADAYWLQADIDCQLVKGLTLGGQFVNMDPKGVYVNGKDAEAYALKVGYAMDKLKVAAAYSDTDADSDTLYIGNVATGDHQSKLYTEAWWNYGYVGRAGAESYMVSAEFDAGLAKLGAYYTDVSAKATGATESTDMQEVTITASKSFGPLDATLAYVYTDADDQNLGTDGKGRDYDSVQAYLTLNF